MAYYLNMLKHLLKRFSGKSNSKVVSWVHTPRVTPRGYVHSVVVKHDKGPDVAWELSASRAAELLCELYRDSLRDKALARKSFE
jgi:hypothetical protein